MNFYPSDWNGLPVYSSRYALREIQVHFPRSKRKRIRKKWAKNRKNYAVRPAAFLMGDRLIAHPDLVKLMMARTMDRREHGG